MTDGQRYFNKPQGVPRRVPAGRVLAHNNAQHATWTGHGTNGFRCWTWPKGKVPRGFKRCKCGWSGLPHVATPGQTCVSVEQVLINSGVSGWQRSW